MEDKTSKRFNLNETRRLEHHDSNDNQNLTLFQRGLTSNANSHENSSHYYNPEQINKSFMHTTQRIIDKSRGKNAIDMTVGEICDLIDKASSFTKMMGTDMADANYQLHSDANPLGNTQQDSSKTKSADYKNNQEVSHLLNTQINTDSPLLPLEQDSNTNNPARETSDQFFDQLEQALGNTLQRRNKANTSFHHFSTEDFRSGIMSGIKNAKNLFDAFAINNANKKKNKINQTKAEKLKNKAKNDFNTLNALVQQKKYDQAATQWETMRTTNAATFKEETGLNTYQAALEKITLTAPKLPDDTITSFSAKDFRSGVISGISNAKRLFDAFAINNTNKDKNKINQTKVEKLKNKAKNDFDTLNALIQQNQHDQAATQWEIMRTTNTATFKEETGLNTYQTALEKITLIAPKLPDDTITSFSTKDFRSGVIRGIRNAKNIFDAFAINNANKKKNKINQTKVEKLKNKAKNDFDTLNTLVQQKEYDQATTQWEAMRTTNAAAFKEETGLNTYQTALEKITLTTDIPPYDS